MLFFYFTLVYKYIFLCAYFLTLNCRLLDKDGGLWDEDKEGEDEHP
jgi:hypothetical protein